MIWQFFHVEQAMKLLIKAKLLEIVSDFPKTHSIKKIDKFIKENKVKLAILVDAYITSRYFIREFHKEGAREDLNL